MVPVVALSSRRDRLDERTHLQEGTRMDSHLCVGIDVGYRSHRVGIAHPDGSILEEFDISHTDAGFNRLRGLPLYFYDCGVRCCIECQPYFASGSQYDSPLLQIA